MEIRMCCAHVSKNRQAGFTLIEVMVVIVILAILAGLVVPKVVGQSDKARVKTTETALSTTSNAVSYTHLRAHETG
jgi:general secretion pathway protein G